MTDFSDPGFSAEELAALNDTRKLVLPLRRTIDYMADSLKDFLERLGEMRPVDPHSEFEVGYARALEQAFHAVIGAEQGEAQIWRHTASPHRAETLSGTVYGIMGELRDNNGRWLLPIGDGRFAGYEHKPVGLFVHCDSELISDRSNRGLILTPYFSLEQMQDSVEHANFAGDRTLVAPRGQVILQEFERWAANALEIDAVQRTVEFRSTWRDHATCSGQATIFGGAGKAHLIIFDLEYSDCGTVEFALKNRISV